VIFPGHVGFEGRGHEASFFYVGHHGGGGILTGVKMHGHLETIGGEPSSCGGPDSARAADHERGAGRAGRAAAGLGLSLSTIRTFAVPAVTSGGAG